MALRPNALCARGPPRYVTLGVPAKHTASGRAESEARGSPTRAFTPRTFTPVRLVTADLLVHAEVPRRADPVGGCP